MTAEQVLAVIAEILEMEAIFSPGTLQQAIVDGALSSYLNRLDDLS